MSDGIIKECKLYLVTLSKKQVKIYVPANHTPTEVDKYMDNVFGNCEWYRYKEL